MYYRPGKGVRSSGNSWLLPLLSAVIKVKVKVWVLAIALLTEYTRVAALYNLGSGS